MKSLLLRAVVYGLVIVLGLLSALPNLLSPSLSGKLPDWYQQNTVSLGLDLQGGSHLLLEADIQGLFVSEYEAVAGELTASLREAGIRYGRLQVTHKGIELPVTQSERVSEAAGLARALAKDTPDGTRRFDVDTNGGRLVLTLTESWRESVSRDAVERSLEVVRRRLDETGLVEPSITRQGSDGILVQMPGVADPSEIRELLGTTAKMTFQWAALEAAEEDVATITLPGAHDNEHYTLEKRAAMAGEHIRDARMAFNPTTNEPVVNFELDDKGARL
ncbi:MAG: SecDF P1 head subdomain-containing protein, partial [Billgrantia desiderata]